MLQKPLGHGCRPLMVPEAWRSPGPQAGTGTVGSRRLCRRDDFERLSYGWNRNGRKPKGTERLAAAISKRSFVGKPKVTVNGRGIFLGFDYGKKRTGVAVGEGVTKTARPLAVLPSRANDFWRRLDRLVETWRPEGLVVGVVGEENPIAREIDRFCRMLERRYRCPVYRIDETMTSQAAELLLKGRSLSHDERRRLRDAVAAALILEDFLRRR